jgi:predicted PurR-regulated permease PerM
MPRSAAPAPKFSRFILLASVCVVVAALYFAQDVLIPLALAMLLTFLLAPLVQWLERRKLGRAPSVLLVVVLAFGSLGVLGYVVFNQVMGLAQDLPTYKDNIKAKMTWLPKRGEGGVLEKIQQTVTELSEEAARPATTQATQAATAPATEPALVVRQPDALPVEAHPPPEVPATAPTTKPIATTIGPSLPGPPVPVTIVPAEASPLDLLKNNAATVAGPLGTAGVVAVFVIFMLLSREDLRDRLIRLIGYGQWTVTTQALDDAASRISRYLLAQAIVNGTYGAAIALGLWLIGKFIGGDDPPFPNVILWGLLCAVLRFIPYIGPWIAAVFPLVLSLAVYKSFGVFIATGLMFVVIELLSNNIMEPLLYGSSTGMSTVAILVSAVFWTWLWGPIGLLMATPLTVCLVVIGKYVPQLQFLDILLGDEPVLAPHERLYQRWLALDPEEAADVVMEFFESRSLEEMYDQIILPAVALAEIDRHNGRLDDRRQSMIRQSTRSIIDELGDEFRLRFARTGATTSEVPGKKPAENGNGEPEPAGRARRLALQKECSIDVLILPAHDEADEIVGLMLAQLLEFNNFCAHPASVQALAGEMMEMVEAKESDVVCISALPPSAVTHSRYICKRLHQRYPEIQMVVGLWTVKGDLKRAKERITCAESVQLATTLSAAMDQVEQLTKPEVVRQIEAARSGEKVTR